MTGAALPSESWTAEEFIGFTRKLCDDLAALPTSELEVESSRVVSAAHVPVVHGLSAHSQRLGRMALDLLERGYTVEVHPIVRTAFECAITAQWVAQSTEATFGLWNEHQRQQRLLDKSFREGWASLVNVADLPELPEEQKIATSSDGAARSFQKRCYDLTPGGAQAYSVYRMLSNYSHATPALADLYAVEDKTRTSGLTLILEAQPHSGLLAVQLTCASIIWSARAIDMMTREHPQRRLLRAAARAVGIQPELKLTRAACERERLQDQTRRRANWKGRVPRNKPAAKVERTDDEV